MVEGINNTDISEAMTDLSRYPFVTADEYLSGNVRRKLRMAKAMYEASVRTGKVLSIGYQSRWRSDSLYLKECCENGEFGEIYYARALALRRRAVPTWGVFLNEEEQGGGPLIDIGTHALDLTLWMMNNYKPKMVVGTKYKKLGDQKNAANAWGDWDPEEYTAELSDSLLNVWYVQKLVSQSEEDLYDMDSVKFLTLSAALTANLPLHNADPMVYHLLIFQFFCMN